MKYSQYVLIIIILLASASLYKQSVDFKTVELQETQALLDVYSKRMKTIINETIKVTKILEELIVLHGGNAPIDEVDRLTKVLYDEQIHINISYAPQGIIEYTYPLDGNKEALGHKLLEDPITRYDALKALELGQSTLSKPYQLRQGNVAAVVRDPVFVQKDGKETFWGFVAIAMRTTQGLIKHSDIDSLENFGYEYKLSYFYEENGEVEAVRVLESGDYNKGINTLYNEFETRYGTWELSLNRITTIDKVLRSALALCMFYASLIAALISTVIVIRQEVIKRKR